MKLTAEEIAAAVGGVLHTKTPGLTAEHISTASGSMKGDDLFVPLLGARVDAHRFIPDAFTHGAVLSFTSEGLADNGVHEDLSSWLDQGRALIEVEDTLLALQKLGRYYRENYVRIPYVGVTGSVGKTTTREMIAAALSAGKATYSTRGNANSQTGVPITVTETDPCAEIGVIEMGISEFGEMQRLAEIVQCDMAVVTTIGISHIANLGSQENIMLEKLHLLNGMKQGGFLFLNGDDPLLKDLTTEKLHEYGLGAGNDFQIVFYGTGPNAQVRAENVEEACGYPSFEAVMDNGYRRRISLRVPGIHMMRNALAAFAVAVQAGVDPDKALEALSAFESMNGRGKILEKDGMRIINDAYNAAPQSMMAGLRVLDRMPAEGRHIAVLADMLELGPKEEQYHREVGAFIARETHHIDIVMLYGRLAAQIGEGILAAGEENCPRIQYFDSLEEVRKAFFEELQSGDIALLKGSNSMKLSAVAEAFSG